MGITKEEIKVLRDARWVAFHADFEQVRNGGERPHFVAAGVEVRNPYKKDEMVEHRFEFALGDDCNATTYDGRKSSPTRGAFAQFERSTPEVAAIFQFLRVGDDLSTRWVFGNTSETVRDTGLEVDELHLRVRRGERLFQFLAGYHVTTAASPGRYVRR